MSKNKSKETERQEIPEKSGPAGEAAGFSKSTREKPVRWPWYHSLYPDLDPVRDRTKYTVMNYRLMDDLFARSALNDIDTIQRILQVILRMPDLQVISVQVQKLLDNGVDRSLWLDALAQDAAGRRFNVEVQNGRDGFSPLRMRYHSSLMDVTSVPKGEDWSLLRETYVIFILDKDYLHGGLPVYEYETQPKGHDVDLDFGVHYIAVNGEWRGSDDIGRLMADFNETDPDAVLDPVLSKRIRSLKTDVKEVKTMCDAVQKLIDEAEERARKETEEKVRKETEEKVRKETETKGREETALNLLKEDVDPELIARATGLALSRVLELKDSLSQD